MPQGRPGPICRCSKGDRPVALTERGAHGPADSFLMQFDTEMLQKQAGMISEQQSVHMNDPCHPGEVLRDWISGHGKTIQEAAELMGVSRATLNCLLSGAGRIAPKLAVQLESMGWSTAEIWLRLQMAHDLAAARRAKPIA